MEEKSPMFDFIDRIGEATVEKIFMSLLEGFTAEDLRTAVEQNISLLDETAKHRPHTLALAEKIAGRFRGQGQHLNYENVMKWLSEKRPDFYLGIKFRPSSQEWMKQQIKEFRTFLFA